ncbi:hypothetical protein HDU76_002397 [Blyttiomyces sp. JEL0837]|nr:hypothetical protein HDU76_002397 [Blyttiomyces sp. JEL0837]
MDTLHIICLGGTLFQSAVATASTPPSASKSAASHSHASTTPPPTKTMDITLTPSDLLSTIKTRNPHLLPPALHTHLTDLTKTIRTGANLSLSKILHIRNMIVEKTSLSASSTVVRKHGILIIAGTDTLDEFAFALQLLLPPSTSTRKVLVALTGAMKPSDILGFDGASNVADSLTVLHSGLESNQPGVVVVMNGKLHHPFQVQKVSSRGLEYAFGSRVAGCEGVVERGRVLVWPRDVDVVRKFGKEGMGFRSGEGSPFTVLEAMDFKKRRVPIVSVGIGMNLDDGQEPSMAFLPKLESPIDSTSSTPKAPSTSTGSLFSFSSSTSSQSQHPIPQTNPMDFHIPTALFSPNQIDALVLSLPGTGSLSPALFKYLSPTHTTKLPIVITTRCTFGPNYDDEYYKGSLKKYVDAGFLVEGFDGLSPEKARILVVCWLALEERRERLERERKVKEEETKNGGKVMAKL